MVRVASIDEIPVGAVKHVEVEGQEVVIVNAGTHLYALNDVCSHEYALLSGGEVDLDRGTIECPKHGSTFDLETGAPQTLPAVLPVRSYGVRLEGDDVMVELLDDRQEAAS
jgi:3-phenylpropionate/trans-cinnamate dioxygenase ferredoxin subunit